MTDGGSRGRPRDAGADRAILRAALEMFIANGPDATSIEQVAKRAGVARLTVYRRWPNKDQLLIAAIDQARDIDDAALYQPLLDTEPEDLDAAITSLFEAIAELLSRSESRGLLARLIGTATSHPELLRTFWEGYLQPRRRLAHSAVRRAIELGGLPEHTDPELILDTVVGATLFPALMHPDPPSERELRERMRAVLGQLGIAVPES
ncbi:TetR/AcrR family transcriptional regulator [Sciscionella marina]|uniref:TetR/AcrR family transcriptional regulator n=1 Tax=Sciscionella marina TaxID=508770 RepID=UPI000377FD88|nr:TetR/AcrR family transcriptional regulator [Sciscionella marina]